jgi:hypothetical protein
MMQNDAKWYKVMQNDSKWTLTLKSRHFPATQI